MANRACSTIVALSVIGNSVHGLHFSAWRKVFLAVVIPTLTYASQVWFTDVRQKSLIHILQVAQNLGCRKIGGFFRTTPTDLMHTLVNIPPIHFRLQHLLRSTGTCWARLPPSSAMRSHDFIRKSTLIPPFLPLPPFLPPIAEIPLTLPTYSPPPSPRNRIPVHPRLTLSSTC